MDSNGTAIGFLLRDRRKHIHVGSRATSLSHSVPQRESDGRSFRPSRIKYLFSAPGLYGVREFTGFPLQWEAPSGVSAQKCSEAGRRAPSDHMDVPNGAFCRLEAPFAHLLPREPLHASESAISSLFWTVVHESGKDGCGARCEGLAGLAAGRFGGTLWRVEYRCSASDRRAVPGRTRPCRPLS